jgi:hypothetical protein
VITGPALLGLFGASQGRPTLSTADTLLLYRTSVTRSEQELAQLRRDPTVQRDLALLDKAVARAKTPEDLLRDPRALGVLLQGLGLGDQAQNAGLARAALLSDPSDPDSLAARLPDARWKTAAQRLGLAKSGLDGLRDPAVLQGIRDGVVQYRRMTAISERSQAVADAIYISQMALSDTPTVYGVLGDAVLRRVATTVAALPQELAVQSVEAQARTLGRRFDVEQFADPKKREALIQRYLAMATMGQSTTTASPLLSLFA